MAKNRSNGFKEYFMWDFFRYVSLVILMILCGTIGILAFQINSATDEVLIAFSAMCAILFLVDATLIYRRIASPSVYVAVAIIFVPMVIRQIIKNKGQISINLPKLASNYEEKFLKYSSCN